MADRVNSGMPSQPRRSLRHPILSTRGRGRHIALRDRWLKQCRDLDKTMDSVPRDSLGGGAAAGASQLLPEAQRETVGETADDIRGPCARALESRRRGKHLDETRGSDDGEDGHEDASESESEDNDGGGDDDYKCDGDGESDGEEESDGEDSDQLHRASLRKKSAAEERDGGREPPAKCVVVDDDDDEVEEIQPAVTEKGAAAKRAKKHTPRKQSTLAFKKSASPVSAGCIPESSAVGRGRGGPIRGRGGRGGRGGREGRGGRAVTARSGRQGPTVHAPLSRSHRDGGGKLPRTLFPSTVFDKPSPKEPATGTAAQVASGGTGDAVKIHEPKRMIDTAANEALGSSVKRKRLNLIFGAQKKDSPEVPATSVPRSSADASKKTKKSKKKKLRPVQERSAATDGSRSNKGQDCVTEPTPDVKRVNELADEVKRLKRYADVMCSNLETEQEKVKTLEKRLRDAEVREVGLRASLCTAEATNIDMRDDGPGRGKRGAGVTETVAKRRRLLKKREVAASETARLPSVQQHGLRLVEKKLLDFSKAVVRQCDPEAFVLSHGMTHKWLPEPKLLSPQAGKGTIDSGGEKKQLVPEPPLLCSARSPARGGLFGAYPGGTTDCVYLLADIVSKDATLWTGVADEEGVLAVNMHESERGTACVAACRSPAADAVKLAMYRKIYNQCSYQKHQIVKDFLKALGYNAVRGMKRTREDVLEAHEVADRLLSFSLGREDDEEEEEQAVPEDVDVDELVHVARGNLTTDRLRMWRTRSFGNTCAENHPRKDFTGYDTTGETDIFFGNVVARACYVRWATNAKMDVRGGVPQIAGDASVLTLARLDAWMGASLLMGMRSLACSVDDGGEDVEKAKKTALQGCNRTGENNTLFEVLLPLAIEGVLGQVREVVADHSPKELHMPFDFDYVSDTLGGVRTDPDVPSPAIDAIDNMPSSRASCGGPEGHKLDLHGQLWRKTTSSHMSPFDGRNYVVALPSFIRAHVCSWIGNMCDAFVGVCDDGNDYVPITAPKSNVEAVEEWNPKNYKESVEI